MSSQERTLTLLQIIKNHENWEENEANFSMVACCSDKILIDELVQNGKLKNLGNDNHSKYSIKCNESQNYTIDQGLGIGAHNYVTSVKKYNDRVLRVTKKNESNYQLNEEITGLFLQHYLSSTGEAGSEYICKVYEFGRLKNTNDPNDERVYAILESCPKSLSDLRYENEEKPINITLNNKNILKQVADGLNYMHKKGYAHLDMKCENIQFRTGNDTVYGTPVIVDFGTATYIPDDGFVNVNLKPTYFNADKNSLFSRSYSKKYDVYSFGAMLLEMYFTFDENPYISKPECKEAEDLTCEWDEFTRTHYDSYFDKNNPTLLEDLIKGMLEHNIEKRLTMEEVVNHNWFSERPAQTITETRKNWFSGRPAQTITEKSKNWFSGIFPFQWFNSWKTQSKNGSNSNIKGSGGKKSRKIYRKNITKKRRQSSFVKSRRLSRR